MLKHHGKICKLFILFRRGHRLLCLPHLHIVLFYTTVIICFRFSTSSYDIVLQILLFEIHFFLSYLYNVPSTELQGSDKLPCLSALLFKNSVRDILEAKQSRISKYETNGTLHYTYIRKQNHVESIGEFSLYIIILCSRYYVPIF